MAARERVDGAKIASLRTARKLDQTELAGRLRKRGLGATQATVSRWENGQEPRAYVLPALAAELGVRIEDLYADADEDEESRGDMVAVLMPSAALRRMVRDELAMHAAGGR